MTKPRVLIVEDDFGMQSILACILSSISKDIEYVWVTSAEEARAALAHAPFTLIVADVYLVGRTTGLDLWEYCQDNYPAIPFVAMSSIDAVEFFRIVGKNRISPPLIMKPLRIGECRQVLEGFIRAP